MGKQEQYIWERFKAGDKESFAQLYNSHVDSMYRYGTKLCYDQDLVKDAIQEVFLDLYMKREKNKTNTENLKYYLILALKRNLIKKLQRNRKLTDEKYITDFLFEPEYSIENTIIEREEDGKRTRLVVNAVNQLPAKQKEAIYLRFNESMEYPEIANLLDISVESVRKQVYRAIKTIRESIGNKSVLLWLFFNSKRNY